MRHRLGALVLAAVVGACATTDGRQVVIVSAAASLVDAFEDLEHAFEANHGDVDIVLNIAGSSTLREQLLEGAPVDVFASANPDNMTAIVDAGLVAGEPRTLARNRLVIAVPAGNPAGVSNLADLEDPSLLVGRCAVGVPCGDLAVTAFAGVGVDPPIDTEEPNVRSLLTKLSAGELDAGVVYQTDVIAAGSEVEAVALDPAASPPAEYVIASVTGGGEAGHAATFVAFALGPAGRDILVRHGFELP